MNRKIIFASLVLGLTSITIQAAHAQSTSEKVNIDTRQLDAAHGWEPVTAGVFQRIDAQDGTISTVSVGDAGRRHDHAIAKAELALARQQLSNAILRHQNPATLDAQIAELEATVQRLAPEKGTALAKGSVREYGGTEFCHSVAGTFEATFSKQPRVGGGVIGSVDASVGSRPCYRGYDWCPPYQDIAPTYRGGTRSFSQATNSAGTVSQTTYSNNNLITDMYNYPSAQSAATTYNVGDSACSLRAGGYINTTFATNEYGGCYLYRSFNVVKTCAQMP